jgi:hypothetical protein
MRNERLQEAGVRPARVIPWLQAFSAPWVDRDFTYGPAEAAAQIKAVHDVGLEDWVFWHPGSRYEHLSEAFRPTLAGHAQPLEPKPEMVSSVQLFEGQGARAARDLVARQASGAAPVAN